MRDRETDRQTTRDRQTESERERVRKLVSWCFELSQ